ncbi:MAG: anti-sigma factor domain-containing protein [Thermoactinomyces sp.]
MQKGVIMEVQGKHWIILTADGNFIKVPKTNDFSGVGEEITVQPTPVRKRKRNAWIAAVSAAAAAMLGTFFILSSAAPEKAYAETYVYLDVNPSVAIALNQDRKVVKVQPLNKSAEKLLKQSDFKGENVDDFAIQFLEAARKNGYLHKKDQVVLSGIKEEKESVSTINSLKQVISEESKNQHLDLYIHALAMPKQVQTKAAKTGLSPAKYAVWVLAKKEGKELPLEKINDTPIETLANDIKPVSELLKKPSAADWNTIIGDGSETDGQTPPQDQTSGEPADNNQNPNQSGNQTPGNNGSEQTTPDQPNQPTNADQGTDTSSSESSGSTTTITGSNTQTDTGTSTGTTTQSSTSAQ